MVPACTLKVSRFCAHSCRFPSNVITISSVKFQSLFSMKTSSQFPSSFSRQTPRGIRVQILLIAFVACLLALACLASGCATTTAGLAREEPIYGIATNVVAHAQQIAPSLLTPFKLRLPILPLVPVGQADELGAFCVAPFEASVCSPAAPRRTLPLSPSALVYLDVPEWRPTHRLTKYTWA